MLAKKFIAIVLPELGTSTSTRANGLVMSLIRNCATTDRAAWAATTRSGKLTSIVRFHSAKEIRDAGAGHFVMRHLGAAAGFPPFSTFFDSREGTSVNSIRAF